MNKLGEDDLIKIKLFGSALYDKFESYEKYLYLIIDNNNTSKDELINKFKKKLQKIINKYKLKRFNEL